MIESPLIQENERVPFTAELRVEDFYNSLDFYNHKLGFDLARIDRESKVAVLRFGDGMLMIKEEKGVSSRGSGMFLRFVVQDIDAYYEDLQKRGAKTLGPPELRSWGAKRFYAEDPDGFKIQFIPKY